MRVWIAVLAIAVAVVVIAAGFYYVVIYSEENGDGNGGPPPATYSFTVHNYPNVDGSTSTHPLGILTACKLLNCSHHWTHLTPDGTYRIVPKAYHSGQFDAEEMITRTVIHHGTHGSYINLIERGADIIVVARLPSDDELEMAASNGVELDARPVALDAFVFIVNEYAPCWNFTTTQIRNIYTGVITNWTPLSDCDDDINPYQRDPNSGSQELMEKLVMQGHTMMDAPNLIAFGMTGPFNMLERDARGIGFTVYFYEEFMARKGYIHLCEVDGVFPCYETIQNRTYPYTTDVYVVIRKDQAENTPAFHLREWYLSEEGQAVVAESGYVPVGFA